MYLIVLYYAYMNVRCEGYLHSGYPFMMSTKNQVFDSPFPLSTCVHMSRTPTPPPCGRRQEIHTALLKWLVQ